MVCNTDALLQTLLREFRDLSDRVNGIDDKITDVKHSLEEKIDSRCNSIENNFAARLSRTDEIVRKAANSVNVVVRLVAVSIKKSIGDGTFKMNSSDLRKILIEAEALTNTVKQNAVVNLDDNAKDVFMKATGNPSFDPINTNVPSNHINSTIPQTITSLAHTTQHLQSSSASSISNECNNADVSSTNTTVPFTAHTSSISDASNTQCEDFVNLMNRPNMVPYIVNVNQEKEKQEQEALRKKYRNKYKYLDKYKNNAIKTNSTQQEDKSMKNQHFSDSNANNINISHRAERKSDSVNDLHPAADNVNDTHEPICSQNCLSSFHDCSRYRHPVFNGVKTVEVIFLNDGDTIPRRIIKPLCDVQPRVLLDLIDANSVEIQQRLLNGNSNSRQSNSSKISDEVTNSNKSNRKSVTINNKVKGDKQKSETLVNVKNNKRKTPMKNNYSAPPKKRASFRKQSNIK